MLTCNWTCFRLNLACLIESRAVGSVLGDLLEYSTSTMYLCAADVQYLARCVMKAMEPTIAMQRPYRRLAWTVVIFINI
jgi:hypothetical protein